jgi:streptogramin lyase
MNPRTRAAALLAVVLSFSVGGVARGAAVGQITEFPTPTAASAPQAIAAGPDGDLWFTESAASKIGTINPVTHAISEFATPSPASFPLGIAAGPDGNLWFTEFLANKIGRINPTTHAITEFTLPAGSTSPVDITTGPNGNLWVTASGNPGAIDQINPVTLTFTRIPAPTANVQPFGIATGPDGNVWFTERDSGSGTPGADSRIGKLDFATDSASDLPTGTASAAPNGITAGPDGSIWITEAAADKVVLLDPATAAMTSMATPTGDPTVIAPGPDGNMWFTEGANPGAIAFINPVTRDIKQFPTGAGASEPVGLATGSDGNLWFAESSASKIGEIGSGAPAASVSPPTISGVGQAGASLTCQAGSWSAWAGQEPSTPFAFDGFTWLRDGAPITGAATATYRLTSVDATQHVSCRQTLTYALVGTTVSATSTSLAIAPSLSASLRKVSTDRATAALTIACRGLAGESCKGAVTLTARAKAKTRTIARGAYAAAAGRSVRLVLKLNVTGRSLLTRVHRLAAQLAIGGTTRIKKKVTFRARRR